MKLERFIVLPLILMFVGCSSYNQQKVLLDNKPQAIKGFEEGRAPVSVAILSEKYADSKLSLVLLLSPLKDLAEGEILLKLVGLKDGGEVGRYTLATDKGLSAGESYEFPLQLSDVDISDYRVDVEWGGRLVSAAKPSIVIDDIQNLGSQCRESYCKAQFRLSATIMNEANQNLNGAKLNSLVLATSFALKDRPNVPDTLMEEVLNIDNLGIEPGGRRKVEITLEQEVPQAVLSMLKPQVRIASFN